MLDEAEEGGRFPFVEILRDRLDSAITHGLEREDWSVAIAREAGVVAG